MTHTVKRNLTADTPKNAQGYTQDRQAGRSAKDAKYTYNDFKYMHRKFKFATHLLGNNPPGGQINEVTDVVYTTNTGGHMNTIEKFYIYQEMILGNQINYRNTVASDKLLDIVILCDNAARSQI
jgi:hypothetical protein